MTIVPVAELKVTPTDTIKVEYAVMALVSANLRIAFRVLEPIEQHTQIFEVSYLSMLRGSIVNAVDLLKDKLLSDWNDPDHMKEFMAAEIDKVIDGRSEEAHWMTKVNKIEAIECNLVFQPRNNNGKALS